jgi:hypothetical protein
MAHLGRLANAAMPASPWMRRVLFVVALLAIPFPYQVVESGRVPAAWLGTVGALIVTSAVTQGGAISSIIARWWALQAVMAIALAYAAARLATAMVRRFVRPERRWLAVATIAAGGLALASLPVFATAAVEGGAPTNLIGIFALR